ncbi:helix-turn-helix transcriptional regulator [Staphylococcus sp. FSL H8-0476]
MKGYSKLKGLLKERGINHDELADLLDVHRVTVSNKLNRSHGADFTMTEVRKLCLYLEVSADIYFLNVSRENTTERGVNMKGYSKLKGLLKERGINHDELADLLDVHRVTVSNKLNRSHGADFTMTEVRKLCLYLEVSADIYFLNVSRENTTKEPQTT